MHVMEYNTKKYNIFKDLIRIYEKVEVTIDILQLCAVCQFSIIRYKLLLLFY